MQKRSKLSTRWKKNKQSTLVYTSQVNLLTQHIVWEFKSIVPHESMLLTATALFTGGREVLCLLAWKSQAAGAPTEIVPGQVTSQGDYQEGWGFFPLFWKTFPGPGEWSSLTSPGSPPSHLSILAFRNRSGQSQFNNRLICRLNCALFQHHVWQQEALYKVLV